MGEATLGTCKTVLPPPYAVSTVCAADVRARLHELQLAASGAGNPPHGSGWPIEARCHHRWATTLSPQYEVIAAHEASPRDNQILDERCFQQTPVDCLNHVLESLGDLVFIDDFE